MNVSNVIKVIIGIAVGMLFTVLIQLFSEDIIKELEQPVIASILAIVGIIATVIVGIVIFLMQKKADNKINKIIISEHRKRSLQKIHFCNKIIHDLNEINHILQGIKGILERFPVNRAIESLEIFI